MVAPEFPPQALREKRSGTVIVEGIVDPAHGQLKDVRLRPETDADAAFVPAVEAVIGEWRFRRGTRNCMPVEAPLTTRVFFEWDGERPKVTTLRPVVDPAFKLPPGLTPLKRVPTAYPPSLARRGVTASVYARMRIEANGVPSSVEVAAYPPEYPELRKAFADETREALLQWRYPERAEGAWRNCVLINFVMKGDDPPVFRDTSLGAAGSPGRTIKPDYPRDALERKQGGFVDMEAVVLPDGRLDNIRLQPGDAASAIFVAPLREVLDRWRFNREIGPDCFPAETPISTRISFEPEGESGKVAVRNAGRPVPPNPRARPETRKGPQPRYPSAMLRKGLQADVYAQVNVAADGRVESVQTQVYPRQDASMERHFAAEVESTLREWEFAPRAAGPWRYCTVVNFRLRD